MHVSYNNDECWKRSCYYTGSDTLKAGQALCYDHDAATTNDRSGNVEKPSVSNRYHFAGLVAPGQQTLEGPCQVELIRPTGPARGVQMWCDQSITSGDVLGVVPGSYALGLGAVATGVPVAMAMETSDKSSTAGRVLCEIGGNYMGAFALQVYQYILNTTTGWTTTQAGTAGTMTLSGPNNVTWSAGDDDDGDGANSQLDGLPLLPAANKDIWLEAGLTFTDIGSCDAFIGLANTDTTVIAASAVTTTDHIGFSKVTSDGVFLLNGEKGGTGTTAAFGTLVAATEAHVAFYVDGVTAVQSFLDGVAPSSGGTLATANIPILGVTPTVVVQANNADINISTLVAANLLCRQFAGQ